MAKSVLDRMLGNLVHSNLNKSTEQADAIIERKVNAASRAYLKDLKTALEKAKSKKAKSDVAANLRASLSGQANVDSKVKSLSRDLDSISNNEVTASIIPTIDVEKLVLTPGILANLKSSFVEEGSPVQLSIPGDVLTAEQRAEQVISLLKKESKHFLNMSALSSAVVDKIPLKVEGPKAGVLKSKLKYKIATAFTQHLKSAIISTINNAITSKVEGIKTAIASKTSTGAVTTNLKGLIEDTKSISKTLGKAYKRAFTIDDKDIRERYKSFVHVLDFKKFAGELVYDLEPLLEEGALEDVYGGVVKSDLRTVQSEDYLKELKTLTSSYVKQLNVEKASSSFFKFASYDLNRDKEYLIVANIKSKSSLTTLGIKGLSYNGARVLVDEEHYNEYKLNIYNKDPFDVIVEIVNNFQAYLLNEASPPLKAALLKLKVGTALLDAGHVNAVISWSSFGYSLRHYIRNTDINTIDFGKEAAYFGAIQTLLESDRTYSGKDNSIDLSVSDKFEKDISNLMFRRLHNEVIAANIDFFRALSSQGALEAVLNLQVSIQKVTDIFKEPEFLSLLENLSLNASKELFVLVKPELAAANRKFGAVVQKLHREYHDLLLQRLRDLLATDMADISKKTNVSIENLQGSPSIKSILIESIMGSLGTGKIDPKTVKSSTSRKSKLGPPIISSVVININGKASRKSVKAKPPSTPAPRPRKIPTVSKGVKVTRPKAQAAVTSVTKGRAPKRQLRTTQGHFTSLTHIRNLLELNLFDTIKKNMTAPRLVFRSGRFASSAQIKSITHGADDVVDIRYTYMKNPYQTFEPGFKQGSLARDPKTLITGSIREVLKDKVLQRLRVTRV